VRLALIQVFVVVMAFTGAGFVARSDIQASTDRTLRREILGEMSSLQDEVQRLGEARLPTTIERRTRMWRGFEYELIPPGKAPVTGRLNATAGRSGWSVVPGRGAWGKDMTFLSYAQKTPDGSWLFVGKSLTDLRQELEIVTLRLVGAGLIGAVLCLGIWLVFAQETWRRLAIISDTTDIVAAGDLTVRVPGRALQGRDDIDDLGMALNQMLDRIQGLIAQLRQVTTDVAHDLRTPMSRMRQKLERLERAEDLPAVHREAVTVLQDDLLELLRTFDALLKLSEIESANLGDEGRLVDVEEVALRVAEAFRPDIEESGRTLTIETSPVTVKGDADLLAQLIANLVENAMRHTPVGSELTVGAGSTANGACLWVADNGPGIEPQFRQAALAPYFRLNESRSSPGSGLGRSIVAAIAARHQARLRLEDNEPGLRVTAVFERGV
jgi:signal transduction histidine kinase